MIKGEFQNENQVARIARPDLGDLVEKRALRFHEQALVGPGCTSRSHVIRESAHVLRMIEDVVRDHRKLDGVAFRDVDPFDQSQINVVDRIRPGE